MISHYLRKHNLLVILETHQASKIVTGDERENGGREICRSAIQIHVLADEAGIDQAQNRCASSFLNMGPFIRDKSAT